MHEFENLYLWRGSVAIWPIEYSFLFLSFAPCAQFAVGFADMLSYLLVAALPALTSAHGHVAGVIADGKWYAGWNAALKYNNPIPPTVGWQADNLDNGFVTPDAFGKVDIVCHKQGKSNGAYVPVKPGSKVSFVWDTWPVSHKGMHWATFF